MCIHKTGEYQFFVCLFSNPKCPCIDSPLWFIVEYKNRTAWSVENAYKTLQRLSWKSINRFNEAKVTRVYNIGKRKREYRVKQVNRQTIRRGLQIWGFAVILLFFGYVHGQQLVCPFRSRPARDRNILALFADRFGFLLVLGTRAALRPRNSSDGEKIKAPATSLYTRHSHLARTTKARVYQVNTC